MMQLQSQGYGLYRKFEEQRKRSGRMPACVLGRKVCSGPSRWTLQNNPVLDYCSLRRGCVPSLCPMSDVSDILHEALQPLVGAAVGDEFDEALLPIVVELAVKPEGRETPDDHGARAVRVERVPCHAADLLRAEHCQLSEGQCWEPLRTQAFRWSEQSEAAAQPIGGTEANPKPNSTTRPLVHQGSGFSASGKTHSGQRG